MSKIVDIDERSFKEKVEWRIYNAKCRVKMLVIGLKSILLKR